MRQGPWGRWSRERLPARLAKVVGVAALALTAATCAPAASSSPVSTTTVDLPKSYRFAPAVITVQAGSTVTWTNHDNFTHNVTFQGEAPRMMAPGEEATRAFPSSGTFAYQCTLHPTDMQGSVIVTGR